MKTVDFTQHLLSIQTELFRFAFKLTADREEANDLLQETSLKALDNEEKFTPDTNFKGWMYTIMRNIFINNYRKVVRDQTFVDTTDNLYHLSLPHDAAFESTDKTTDILSPGYKIFIRSLDKIFFNAYNKCIIKNRGKKECSINLCAFRAASPKRSR